MRAKKTAFQEAIRLRHLGKSYSEIAALLTVSKSTLSLWLRNVELDESIKSILESKKFLGQQKGGLSKKNFRILSQNFLELSALKEIDKISNRELWLLGIIAYWCEGSKQKEYNVSQPVVFANSDPILLKLFVKWLKVICKINENDILYTIYIHENANSKKALLYWSKEMNILENKFTRTILKKHKVKTKRKNIDGTYNGLLRVTVRRSTNLNRKIKGWVLGINNFI